MGRPRRTKDKRLPKKGEITQLTVSLKGRKRGKHSNKKTKHYTFHFADRSITTGWEVGEKKKKAVKKRDHLTRQLEKNGVVERGGETRSQRNGPNAIILGKEGRGWGNATNTRKTYKKKGSTAPCVSGSKTLLIGKEEVSKRLSRKKGLGRKKKGGKSKHIWEKVR